MAAPTGSTWDRDPRLNGVVVAWRVEVFPGGLVVAHNPTTGELREIQRATIESAFKTLGRGFDRDRAKASG